MRDHRIGVTSTVVRDAGVITRRVRATHRPCNRAWRPVGFTSAVSPPVLMDEFRIRRQRTTLGSLVGKGRNSANLVDGAVFEEPASRPLRVGGLFWSPASSPISFGDFLQSP